MASVTTLKNGTRRVDFKGLDGKRRYIRLGDTSDKAARLFCARVEFILEAAALGHSLDPQTAQWLASRPEAIIVKLTQAGLIHPPEKKTAAATALGAFVDEYITKRTDTKQTSKEVFGRARKHLVEFFGADRLLASITPGDASDWRLYLIGKPMADATVRKMCGIARQFFKAAVNHRLVDSNPFAGDDIKTATRGNAERFHFITQTDARKVLDACPNAEWRLIFGLSRWGGLRCPSEHLSLKWEHVNWEHNRLTIPSPKTAHHEGHAERLIPLFPEVRVLLEAVFDEAPEGAVDVITRYRSPNANLRTQLERIIRRAGLPTWERLFHNLRASRQTELADQYPEHVVSQWMGNSVPVARKHYLHTLDEHFERAITAQQKAQHDSPQTEKIDASVATGIG